MTKVRIQASAENVNNALEDRGDFVLPPVGYYLMKVVEANAGFSKGEDGEEDKTRPRIEVILDYVAAGKERKELEANYGRVWHYVSFSKESGDSRANFVRAFYPDAVTPGAALDVEIDTDELVERLCMARIKHETDKLKTDENKAAGKKEIVKRARIARFFPADDDSFTEAEDATNAYAGAEDTEPDGNPFEEQTDGGGELLTQEELDAMDIKEVGAVAKEFDLTPDEYVVKVKGKVDLDKTKAAVIAAILEAQGAEEETGGGDDASPF
jgi:hypothetical protein